MEEHRSLYLLREAARALENQSSFFSADWWDKHNVTVEEHETLVATMGFIILSYLAITPKLRDEVQKAGAASSLAEEMPS